MNFILEEEELTAAQQELVDKFNAAFYQTQVLQNAAHQDLGIHLEPNEEVTLNLETFDNDFSLNNLDLSNLSDGHHQVDDGFFSDGLASDLVTPSSDCTSTFDYDDFSESFDHFNGQTNNGNYFNCGTLLPPISCITDNHQFDAFLRGQECDSLHFHQLEANNNQFNLAESANYSYDDENLQMATLEENLSVLNEENEEFEVLRTQEECLQCCWADCYQQYESQQALVRHIEKEHVEIKRGDEFTCFWDQCPRASKPFNARYKLLIHMRVHSGEKPNKCPFSGCEKAFSRLENLKIHQRSHTGERPYRCQYPMCSKSFSNSSDRAKHQRTHFDTKPYACQIKGCSKKYTDPSSLRKHVKNHSPEEQKQLKYKNDIQGGHRKAEILLVLKQEAQLEVCKVNENDHKGNYSLENTFPEGARSVKEDIKNKLSKKIQRNCLLLDYKA